MAAYNEIKRYLWNTSGMLTIEPLVSLVDILEEAVADDKRVIDVTGLDVAAFADELVCGKARTETANAKKLNDKLTQ